MTITPEELARLLAGITPGPWRCDENRAYETSWLIRSAIGNKLAQVANFQDMSLDIRAEFNAKAMALVPQLLAEVIQSRRTLERYRGALERADTIARQYVSNDCASEIRRVTGKALKEN